MAQVAVVSNEADPGNRAVNQRDVAKTWPLRIAVRDDSV